MPKKISAEIEKEFEELSLFLEYYWTEFLGIARDNEIHPLSHLQNLVDRFGKSKTLHGLKQSINDTIEATQDLDSDQLRRLDESLTSKGIVTLSVLRKRYWSKVHKIINRATLKNETEYYIAVGLLADKASDLTDDERNSLSELVLSYEQNT